MVTPAMDKVNILYVFGGEKAQGAEIVIERLMDQNAANIGTTHLIISPGVFAEALIRSGKSYRIQLLNSLKKLNRSSTNFLKFSVKAIRNYISVSFSVYRYIKKNRIDIVHANTILPASYLIPLIWCAPLLLPKVRWLWSDHDLKYFSKLENVLADACVRLYDNTLVVSDAVKKKYLAQKYYNNVITLYNGLDPAVFKIDDSKRSEVRAKFNIGETERVIGIAGSINPDKGQLMLINVFEDLQKEMPDIKLLIAGSYASQFPDYALLVKAAVNNNDHIIFAGFITDMTAFYNACEIVVNNSNEGRSESLGTTIYEGMACERILVAADTGGTSEIISDEIDGFLFPVADLEQLKEKLTYALKNWDALGPARMAARDKIIRKFNITTMVSRYMEIIAN